MDPRVPGNLLVQFPPIDPGKQMSENQDFSGSPRQLEDSELFLPLVELQLKHSTRVLETAA